MLAAKPIARLALPLSLVVALGACGNRSEGGATATDAATGTATEASDDTAAATAAPGMDTGGTGAAADAAMPLTGQAFVDQAAASDQFEIQSARIAQSKGVTGPWRDFAQMMTKDHTRSSAELKAAVGKAQGVTLPEATELPADLRAQVDQLQAASGDNFRKLYASQQLAAHEKALQMLKTYGHSGDAQPLMDFANKTAPVVQHHLDMVRKMQPG
ncbi:DUF4142 domain-containing protein [Novosphingobium huizhouense]|uniref:DUF4142 domain-containing protein n=1 Tax=Novosphingobium huizhouense TaxID=2866625 RepID=UPI001CD846DC|nr:DUF4142 domain-containing protein [Novosphingobium huizhouense]